MKKNVILLNVLCVVMLSILVSFKAKAQDEEKFKPHGKLWGYAFGDWAYKSHADTVGGGRGVTQYSKVAADMNMFQFRRIYLGYNYEITEKFAAEFLLSSDDYVVGGDVLTSGKFAPYIKLANIRWKNIWKGTDFVLGQVGTPAYPMMSEVYWGYRSIEKMQVDVLKTGSYDFGATLQGKLVPGNDNYGYNVMVSNGNGAKPETDRFKMFSGDIYAKFMDKKIVVDLYTDYSRLHWVYNYHHDRSMLKLFAAYSVPKFTVGVEAFYNRLMRDNVATRTVGGTKDTITTTATGVSIFAKGRIYKDKLGFFARYDMFNPAGNINNTLYKSYSPMTSAYNPNTQEQFFTAGIDFTPVKNVHFMPNVWYNAYNNAGPATPAVAPDGTDMVYRITFYYVYGK